MTLPAEDEALGGRWAEERTRLRKSFFRFDMIFFLVCTLVGLDTLGAVAANGPQGLVWMVLLALVFFVPYGLLVAELGTAFPVEGGPYVWTKLAFGRAAAGVNQVLYWISNPLWVGGTLTILAVKTWESFFTGLPGGWKYIAGLAFIWLSAAAVLLSFRVGKWVPTIGGFARIILLGGFTVSVGVYAVEHGVHAMSLHDLSPTYTGFIALVPLLIFNYVGFELPSTAAEEMNDPKKDIPATIARSGLMAMVLYGGPIVGVLFVLPAKQLSGLGGFIDACKAVFTVYGGHVAADGTVTLTGAGAVLGKICALGLIIGVLTSGVTWAMGGDRAQAVACADGAGPAFLGRFSSRFGTPVRVNVLSGLIATAVMVAAFLLTKGNGEKYFSVGLALAISTTFISYVLTFPSLIVLRRRYPDVPRPYRVPGGTAGAWVVTVLTTALVAFTVVMLIWPGFGVGWFGTGGSAAASLPSSFADQRLAYTLSQIVPIAICVGIGLLFYALGAPTRRSEAGSPVPDKPLAPAES